MGYLSIFACNWFCEDGYYSSEKCSGTKPEGNLNDFGPELHCSKPATGAAAAAAAAAAEAADAAEAPVAAGDADSRCLGVCCSPAGDAAPDCELLWGEFAAASTSPAETF